MIFYNFALIKNDATHLQYDVLRLFINYNKVKDMKKIRAAVVGYGNIGHYAIQALEAADDFEIAGVVRRHGAENKPAELAQYEVVKDIRELKDVDVAILATPTRSCEEYAKQISALGINTVDSFDIHTSIVDYRRTLSEECKKNGTVSIIAAGWDPGSDSDAEPRTEGPQLHQLRTRHVDGPQRMRAL